jgi:pyruvate,orthophosphate dikinase
VTFVHDSDQRLDLPPEETVRLLGGKAAQLRVMAVDLGLPVPPSFTIDTGACREYLATGWPPGLDEEVRDHMARLGVHVGRRFGDPTDPLLVSVRSGAPVSMPGMMDTILNLGLNDATTEGLARTADATKTSGDAFAQACRGRLQQTFRDIVGVEAPQDPWAQLRLAIEAVFRSWNGDRARAYRQRERIPDDLGTAVTVQAMVFGNLGADSATGVVFTRDPATGEPGLYGDVLFSAQGEDVVAGTHATLSVRALDERLPEVGPKLHEYADRLERHYRDLCDIEFTIERGRLWMLQVRVGKRSPQASLRIARDMADDPTFPLSKREAVERVVDLLADPPTTTARREADAKPLATGLAASPGVSAGEIATSPEGAELAAEAGRSVILVRAETSPEDVHGMARAAGILTTRGGLASHAAVVARGWGIPAVVGASDVEVGDGTVVVGGRTFREGAVITIDGATGEVFEGAIAGTSETVPEAGTLLAWAEELGIAIPTATSPDEPARGPVAGAVARSPALDDCVRTLSTKGFATMSQLADALLSAPELVQPLVDRLVEDGVTTTTAGSYRLTDTGRARAADLLAVDREAWGIDAAAVALDEFAALDARMKETVTAWQLRPADGEPVINDHADEAYDRDVLGRLEALHGDAAAWLGGLEPACPRLTGYRARLGRALVRATAGDQRFVASPRVDSYHGVWFELHEDLIALAGRTREGEAAAGRA